MAFLPYSYDDGQPRPWEYLPAGNITPKVGLGLVQSSGVFAVAGATAKPTYISMAEYGSAVASGTLIPVIRVDHGIVFETTNTAAMSGVNIGQSVTTSDGLKVTATTSSGVAEVISYDGKASAGAGGKVRVRF